jgi:hypothetical protein
MRIAVVLGVVLVLGCKDQPSTAETPEQRAAWLRITELARPRTPPGAHDELTRALAVAERNASAWSERRFATPPAQLADYPEGREARAALVRWAHEDGGLPPAPKLPGPRAMQMYALGGLAIATSTDADRGGLLAGARLGLRLVTEGSNLLEATIGVQLLSDARVRAIELGGEVPSWPVARPGDLVRVLAVEATYSREMAAFAQTPEGKQALLAQLAALDPEGKQRVEAMLDRKLAAPDVAEQDAMRAFWLAALDGARPDDTVDAALARLRAAAAGVRHPKAATAANQVVQVFEELHSQIAVLSKPAE